ncbi:MAG TPA: amidohydrolase family protein [Acidimicrobiales bacterium]|nr:amidohydrolase family protein [Acidimicrobiales bacterium]
MIVDADSHLYETRDLWLDRTPAAGRDKALRIVDDEHGYAWLTLGDRRIEVLGVHQPGTVDQSGDFRLRLDQGLPPRVPYDDMPASFWDPGARIRALDGFGIDEAVLLPNCGIMWERALEDDLEATKLNMEAWNRRAVEVVSEGGGRLHPVGHLSLRDPEWFEQQVRALGQGGVRLCMVAPSLADGRRLSHPRHERAWSAMEEAGVALVFHIAQYHMPFDDAWNEGDPDWSNPVMSSVFMWTAPAMALADLAVRGVLHRHPDLRVGVVELMSAWLPQFLLMLDGGFGFHAAFNGRPLTEMPLKPSEYITRQVRVAAFPFERPDRLRQAAGDMFMFGSDFPHPEGLADPVPDFLARMDTGVDDSGFFGANASWLLGRALARG